MSRTNARYEQSSPFTDALFFIPPTSITEAIASPVGLLAVSTDLVSYHIPASQTAALFAFDGGLVIRTGMLPFLQEQFGTAAGVAGPSGVANTSDPSAIPSPYFPPFTGSSELTPATGYIPKGIQITSLDIDYIVGTADLTTFNIKLIARQFKNNVASPTDTALIASTNLTKTHRTNHYLISTAVTTPAFTVTPDTTFEVIINAVTPSTSTLDIYGLVLNYSYNFN